ncbi:MAG TPA: GAF domain-containing SpoIIE family protein phosphatase [Candidatus Acidoferrum sp.]|nr:GAF domain-containing SpoIIE family protein phosphatase [Candidatus Acidoferrum sp.]
MADSPNPGAFALLGDADPVRPSREAITSELADSLGLLYEVSRELSAILDREELLRRIAQKVKALVDFDVFSVMLWNDSSQLLETIFALKYKDAIPLRVSLGLQQGLTGAAASERQVVRVGDVRQDPRYITCLHGIEVRSELVVPLLVQDRLIGVLDLESTKAHSFTSCHEQMLQALGSFIAVALENARLYQETRDTQLRLQQDLDTAREIQRGLLPNGAREVPGLDLAAAYVPARELGGDFYDFLPYGKGRLGFALGDVSGKGTAAALFGSLAIGMLREHVVTHLCPPAEMLATLNHRLNNARLDSRFIAMLFAVYDAPSHRLMVANAGGPYPLLVRDSQVKVIRLEGVPLGLLAGTEYDEMTVDLRPGDIVLFTSDGILESENVAEEEFGLSRLSALLAGLSREASASCIAEQILEATDNHGGVGVAPRDDRTLVVLRVTDETSSDYSKLPIIY